MKSFNSVIRKRILYLTGLFVILVLNLLCLSGIRAYAGDDTVYADGIYRYKIVSGEEKKVQLVGIETDKKMKELAIPGKVLINGKEYTVDTVNISWAYYTNEKYAAFYNGVKKLNVAKDFTGSLYDPCYAFPNLNTIEFYGENAPREVTVYLSNRDIRDFLFIIPSGTESKYEKAIKLYISYYVVSDLYEQEIELAPTIVSKSDKYRDIEYSCFAEDGLIYKVTKSAKNGTGKVELVGITQKLNKGYLELPEKVRHNGYTYKLTALRRFCLAGCGARVIVVPDSVTKMEGHVFDKEVEILFLSKNCKEIPSYVITDENMETNLRFVYVPEGVTVISDYAFYCTPNNTSSIILPTSVRQVGKKSLYAFRLVTFLNKKPLDNVASAVNKGTKVKVNGSVISKFKKILGSKVSVVAARNIVKAKNLTVSKEKINLGTDKTAKITASLTKGSNENIYWQSSDPDIIEVSSKGVIIPKKAGTAYVIAYTRTSGRHKAVKIKVSYTTFDDGIFTYRITNPVDKTAALCQVRPGKTLKTLTIPETVRYKNVKYTVTEVIADPDDPGKPLIPDKYSKNKINKIVFPKSITGKVGYLGILNSVKNITFKGKTAPKAINNWYNDGGILAWQAVIYVPKGTVSSYNSVLMTVYGDKSTYQESHYNCPMDFNIVESGNDQVMRFLVDGILYRVTKYAGKKNGKAAVIGVDVNLKKIVIKSTVTYNGYTYDVIGICEGAIHYGNNNEVYIEKSIKERNMDRNLNIPVM